MDIEKEVIKRYQLQEEYLGVSKPVNKIQPLVSITTTTYQHVNYIEDCVKGVLMQQTTFAFEFIIGEDGSTDGTREICEKFANEHPDIIRLFIRDRNISQLYDQNGNWVHRLNGTFNRMSARGKYIAVCEGDDYWIDALKLQKQVDFLEANPDYGLCSGGYIDLIQDSGVKKIVVHNLIEKSSIGANGFTYGLEEMKDRWMHKTLTVVFRNQYDYSFLYQYKKYRDLHLYYHLIKMKNAFYFTDVFGVYRRHAGGVSSSQSTLEFSKTSYLNYKALWEVNNDEFTRYKYSKSLKVYLSNLLNTEKKKTFKILHLIYEALSISNGIGEKLYLIKYLLKKKIIYTLRYLTNNKIYNK